MVAARLGQGDAAEARERARALHAYRRKLARYGVLPAADEAELAALEAEDIAARLSGGEATALQGLIALGEAAAAQDPKLAGLVAAVRAIRADRPRANVLVYTEYADSQDAACAALRAAGIGGEVLAISGVDDEAARTAAAERCASADEVILVSTDSLAEGLNLHRRCRDLIHLDLPYNPNRLEQRNGRIDRYGQVAEPLIRYLYLADTFEEALLLRLIGKYEKARAALTFMPDTLGQPAAEPDDAFAEAQAALSPGPEGSPIPPGSGWFARRPDGRIDQALAEPQASLFPDPRAAMPTLDRSAEASQAAAFRDLLREIDRAYDGFERMALRHGWLAGQGLQADAALLEPADRAGRPLRRRGEAVPNRPCMRGRPRSQAWCASRPPGHRISRAWPAGIRRGGRSTRPRSAARIRWCGAASTACGRPNRWWRRSAPTAASRRW
ncbi:MAG: SWF/SNF helicase family protein [Rhodospirillales bacterium]|nr:SWF/SNF helicase family protein [Rhodospirillales bacterium]